MRLTNALKTIIVLFTFGVCLFLVNRAQSSGVLRLQRNRIVAFNACGTHHNGHAAAVVVDHHGHHVYGHQVRVLAVETHNDYYYSVQSYYRDKLLADAVALRVTELIKGGIIDRKVLPVPPMPSAGEEKPGPAKTPTRLTIDPKLVKVVEERCLKCHTNEKPDGGLSLEDLSTLSAVTLNKMYRLVNTGRMPKGGEPIRDEEVALFEALAESADRVAARQK
jgi:hypothetical protein